jgi:hypothetical protein
MKNTLIILMMVALITGCGGRPAPDWTLKSFNRLEDFKKQYLEGNTRMAILNFNRAIDEIKKSGNLDVLARAYLTRMAMEAALLEKVQDESYLEVDAAEPNAVHRNFHAFLTGQMSSVKEQLLPDQYRRLYRQLSTAGSAGLAQELRKMEDPFSRIIGAGICAGQGRIDEDLINTGIETASQYGWKKALLVYLDQLQIFYKKHNQQDKAAAVAKRMQLITR